MSTQQPGDAGRPGPAPASGLEITVDRDAEIPIGVQLAWALRTRIRDGQFKPRQRLPGLREVAEATGVNVNTVRAVYQRLEQEGLIDSQQGSGTFVAASPPRASAVASIAADAAREAHETGVDPRDVAAALYVSPERPAQSADAAAARRRLLREQIAALERTLGELEAKYPGVAPAAEHAHRGIGPALLSVDELELVRTTLVRRLSVVQAAIDEIGSERRARTARSGRQGRSARAQRSARAPAGAQEQRTDEEEREDTAGEKPSARPRPRTRPAPAGA
ncbi:MAG TPA: GntR family transcriptional regulator [Solirubrobacteraceae bacterium]|nr:GntR family transcriptional regulator [Solirubrobacteraceae bacterium]